MHTLHNRTTTAARLAWAAYTSRPWAMAADAVIGVAMLGVILWIL